jgi:hypothetical protein
MQVDSAFTADVREMVSNKSLHEIAGMSPTSMSIGAVVELACLRLAFPSPFQGFLDTWSQTSPFLRNAFLTQESGAFPSQANMWAARQVEFFPIRGQNWAEVRHYHPFESRFRKAAKEAGFGDKADGLAGALFEMADNVAQHSGTDPSHPTPGLIGYYTTGSGPIGRLELVSDSA